MAFDGFEGQTISLEWHPSSTSALTVEYWTNILDTHLEQAVFAYSVYSVAGRYGQGGAPCPCASCSWSSPTVWQFLHREVAKIIGTIDFPPGLILPYQSAPVGHANQVAYLPPRGGCRKRAVILHQKPAPPLARHATSSSGARKMA